MRAAADDEWDALGKSFGQQRRKDSAIGRQALDRLEQDQKADANAFRQTIFGHLTRIKDGCENPGSFFPDEYIDYILGEMKTRVKADTARELVKDFLRLAMNDMQGMLLCNDPGRDADWFNLGIFADDMAGTVYARVFDVQQGSTAIKTVAVAYYDDQHMVPAVGSDWFWDLKVSVGVRMPIPMPFSRPVVDPANDVQLIDDLSAQYMDEAARDIQAALDKAEADPKDYQATEELRIQIALSAQRCLPLNKLLTTGVADAKEGIARWAKEIEQSFTKDHVLTGKNILAWCRQWSAEYRKVSAFRRSVILFSDKKIKIPTVMPGTLEAHVLHAMDEKEIAKGLRSYIDNAKSKQMLTEDVIETVVRVRPDLAEAVKGKDPEAAANAIKSAL